MPIACGHSPFTAEVVQLGKENYNENYRFNNTHPHAHGRTCYGANGC
jgi:hypothetical protein